MSHEWTDEDQKSFEGRMRNETMPMKWLDIMGLDETMQILDPIGYIAHKIVFNSKTLVEFYQLDKLEYK